MTLNNAHIYVEIFHVFWCFDTLINYLNCPNVISFAHSNGTYLVVRRYFCIERAIAGKTAWAVSIGSSELCAPGIFESDRS